MLRQVVSWISDKIEPTVFPTVERLEAEGVRLRFEQAANGTIVVFERPGSQVAAAKHDSVGKSGQRSVTGGATWSALPDNLNKNVRGAMELAAANGNVTTRALADSMQVTKRTASTVLRKLAERGLLEWVGKGPSDPNQFYRIPR